jgi:hypothetical protein
VTTPPVMTQPTTQAVIRPLSAADIQIVFRANPATSQPTTRSVFRNVVIVIEQPDENGHQAYKAFEQYDYLMVGDCNRNGCIDLADLGIFSANYGTTSGATWDEGDFDGDGDIDLVDLGAMAGNYGR